MHISLCWTSSGSTLNILYSGLFQAISWCPWQTRLLATGGGTSDRHIRFWNTNSGTCVRAVDTKSQVGGIGAMQLWHYSTSSLVRSSIQYALGAGKDELVFKRGSQDAFKQLKWVGPRAHLISVHVYCIPCLFSAFLCLSGKLQALSQMPFTETKTKLNPLTPRTIVDFPKKTTTLTKKKREKFKKGSKVYTSIHFIEGYWTENIIIICSLLSGGNNYVIMGRQPWP